MAGARNVRRTAGARRLAAALLPAVVGLTLLCSAPAGATTTAAAAPAQEGRPVLYLTFDDGPGPDTGAVLDLLAAYGVPATFFMIGRNVAAHPDLARRVVAEGHAVGDHSWSHPVLSRLGDARIHQELASTRTAITEATGVATSCYRPPYGSTSARVHRQAVAVGLTNAGWTAGSAHNHLGLWDVDTLDWRLSQKGSGWSPAAMRNRLDRARGGQVILMHDGPKNRGRGVAVLASWLAANHDRFEFRALPGCNAGGAPAPEPAPAPAPSEAAG